MPPRNLGNRNPGIERLGDDPPLLQCRPSPAASHPGAYLHPPKRKLRVAYSVGHMCETFPPNQREACDIPRASIKVGAENRLRITRGLFERFETLANVAEFFADRGKTVPHFGAEFVARRG